MSVAPGTSNGGVEPRAGRASLASTWDESATIPSAIGTFTRKMAGHPRCSVSHPPSAGPIERPR